MNTLSDGVARRGAHGARREGASGFTPARMATSAERPGVLGALLDDPDFVIGFQIARRTRTVNDYGRAVTEEEILPARGAVQPATPEELERLPEGDRYRESISVWTLFALRDGNADAPVLGTPDPYSGKAAYGSAEGDAQAAPDVVICDAQGRSGRFVVAALERWGEYSKAICVREMSGEVSDA